VSAAITTHVLDTARGRPAAGVAIVLERSNGDGWERVGAGSTDADGRLRELGSVDPGHYRLTFDTGGYFAAGGQDGFYPEVVVNFTVQQGEDHYHVPLLLNPHGYSTYRGS
jgi:5-hydroxyisourate hydrolase